MHQNPSGRRFPPRAVEELTALPRPSRQLGLGARDPRKGLARGEGGDKQR